MRAREVMTAKVATVAPDDTLAEIVEALIEQGVSAVPVVADGELVGMVSEGDLLRRRELGTEKRFQGWRAFLADPDETARDYVKRRGLRARDVMTKPVITVAPDTPLAEIADLMEQRHIKRVPVLDGDKLVGLVSRADLVRALSWQRSEGRTQTDDAAIINTLRQRLHSQRWADSGAISIAVRNGAVTLSGFVSSAAQRDAIEVMAASIPGVTGTTCALAIRPYTPIAF